MGWSVVVLAPRMGNVFNNNDALLTLSSGHSHLNRFNKSKKRDARKWTSLFRNFYI